MCVHAVALTSSLLIQQLEHGAAYALPDNKADIIKNDSRLYAAERAVGRPQRTELNGFTMSGVSEEEAVVYGEERLKVPPHIIHAASYQNLSLGVLSDSESEEYHSRSSGLDYEIVDDCESTLHEMACAPVTLQSYIVDDLIPTSGDEDGGSPPPDVVSLTLKDAELLPPPCRIPTKGKWKRLTWPLLLFVVLGVGLVVLARGHLLQLLHWLEHVPWWERFLVFIFLFTIVSFPFGFGYIILNMMSGYLYGFLRGQITVTVSVTVGFSVAFLVCRRWMRDYARSVIMSSTAMQALMRVMDGPNGLKVIILTRFTPIPFGLQNILFAVSFFGAVWWKR